MTPRLKRREFQHVHINCNFSLLYASSIAWCEHCSVTLPHPLLGVCALFVSEVSTDPRNNVEVSITTGITSEHDT